MNRFAALVLTAVLVVASISALPAASAATTTYPAASAALQADANATDVSPGQRLAGTIGAGQAEFEGEVTLRAYGIQFALADSNASKAAVIEERLDRVRDRLQTLEQRKLALEEARENGSMSEGEYRARVTALAARNQQLEQLLNASESRARGLPEDVLAERGLNVTAIHTLQAQAANLTGREVAEIARSIAGPGVGRSISDGPPGASVRPEAPGGSPGEGEASNASEADARAAISDAQSQVATAQQRLERANARAGANASSAVADAIEDAEADLERAQAAIDRAQAALDGGDVEAALEHAREAIEHAENAEAHADGAIDAAGESGRPTETSED